MSERDDELLRAAKRWQDQARARIQKWRDYKGIKESRNLADLLKPLEREVKRHQRHPITNWQEVWVKVVGAELAAATKVKKFSNGFLEIEVNNSALKSELESFYSEELTQALKEELPTKKLRKIKFKLSAG